MKKLEHFFEQKLLSMTAPGGSSFLLAVSGGMDSICLLHLFSLFREKYGFCITIAYVNHNLRGPESLAEETFVIKTAASYDIPCFVHSVDAGQWKKRDGLSVEMKAREIRYAFFCRVMDECSCDFLVTAHNFNDKIETLFLQLFRAGGTETLVSIPGITGYKNVPVIRPLLEISRVEIAGYVKAVPLKFVEDSTNGEDLYKRNIVRNKLFPLFPLIHRDYPKSFKHLFSYLDEQDSYIKEETRGQVKNCLVIHHPSVAGLDQKEFAKLHPFMKKNVIKACLKLLGYPVKPNRSLLEAACGIGRIVYRKKGFILESKKHHLWLIAADNSVARADGSGCTVSIKGQGEKRCTFNGYSIVFELSGQFNRGADFVLSSGAAQKEMTIRRVTPGDRILIRGKKTDILKKLKEAGYPEELFVYACLVEIEGESAAFFCLDYFRVSSKWYVPDETEQALKISYSYGPAES